MSSPAPTSPPVLLTLAVFLIVVLLWGHHSSWRSLPDAKRGLLATS